jgi:hypothetical protein
MRSGDFVARKSIQSSPMPTTHHVPVTKLRDSATTWKVPHARYSLAALLLVVTFVAIASALGRYFGMYGWLAAGESVVVLMGIAHLLQREKILGVHVWRVTIPEVLVCLGIGGVLLGLLLPAVQSNCRPRRPAAGTAVPVVSVAPTVDPSSGAP